MLTQILGVYIILFGLLVLIRRKTVIRSVADLGNNSGLIFFLGCLELLGGLAIVFTHNQAQTGPEIVVFIIGCLLVIEALFYLGASTKGMKWVLKKFNTPMWYVLGGLLSMVLGIYLLLG